MQEQPSGNSGIVFLQKLKQNQSHSNYFKTQSTLSQKNISAITNSKKLDNNINAMQKMNKKDVRKFKGGFIPDEVKTLEPRGRKDEKTSKWQGSSDREESLSDPRWHKRPPATRKQKLTGTITSSSKESVKDARALLSSRPSPKIYGKSYSVKTRRKHNHTQSENDTSRPNRKHLSNGRHTNR